MLINNRIKPIRPGTATRQQTAIHLVQSSSFAQRLARILLLGLVTSIVGMAFLPWQQTSRGTGRMVAYVPQERQQTVESQVKGIISRVADGLVEGSRVQQGDFILEIEPLAVNLRQQLEAQKRDLQTKLETANTKAEAYAQNVSGFSEARDFAVKAAEEMIEAAEAKLASKQQLVSAYEARETQARLNYERQKSLYDSGIKPAREIEQLKKDLDVASAELKAVKEEVREAENELDAKQDELEEKRHVAQTKIDYARAMEQDALGSAATIRKDIRELEIELEGLNRLTITAPRDGTIFRMPVYERGQTIKEGESLFTIVPDTSMKAVELLVPGNDMPLIEPGQEVRLQFEGWPAVQFPGWPSVAIGTFSGKVASVDATDNGLGKFRILVIPNEQSKPWPSDRFLRQGVRANGWVMLRRVTLGYEIWRQLNGFPVMVADKEPDDRRTKPPKLP
jgi:multidrug resistance efflux pump